MMVGVDDNTGFYYVILSLLSNILWMITIKCGKESSSPVSVGRFWAIYLCL